MRQSKLGKVRHKSIGMKISKTKKDRIKNGKIVMPSGKNHPNWLGGISNEQYPKEYNKELKEVIRARDSCRCKVCNEHSKIVHHIDYNKKNNSLKNLTIVCHSCHSKTNYNRSFWKIILTEKMKKCLT